MILEARKVVTRADPHPDALFDGHCGIPTWAEGLPLSKAFSAALISIPRKYCSDSKLTALSRADNETRDEGC